MRYSVQVALAHALRGLGLLLVAAAFSAVPVVLIRLGLGATPSSFVRDFILGISGAYMGLLATLVANSLNRREQYRQGAYTERAKAVQSLLHDARVVKTRAVGLADQPALAASIYAAVEESKGILLRNAFEQSVWVGEPGVEAVRVFNFAITRDRLLGLKKKTEIEDAVERAFDGLRRALMGDLGYVPD